MFRRAPAVLLAILVTAALATGLAGCADNEAKPATAEELVQAGLQALADKDQGRALSAFEQAAEKDPENHFAHYNIGFIKQQQGKSAEALKEYQLALASKPDFIPALYNSGTIYGASDAAHAMSIYRRVIKLDPKYASAYFNLGLLEAANGQAEQGRRDLERAIQLDPTFLARVPAPLRPGLKTGEPRPTP